MRQENRANSSFLSLLVYSDFQWVRWWSLMLERAVYFSESSNSDANLQQKHSHRHTHKSYLIWAPLGESRWPIKFMTTAWGLLSIVITNCMTFLSPNTCWFLKIKSQSIIIYVCVYIYIHTHTHIHTIYMGFPGGSDSKESACNAGDLDLIPGLRRPLEEGMATHFSSPHGQRSLAGYSPWGH